MEILIHEPEYEVPVTHHRNSAIYQTIPDPQAYETPAASSQLENFYHILEPPGSVCDNLNNVLKFEPVEAS